MAASFVLLFYGLMGRWDIATPIFLAAAATDLVDGSIARLLKQRTRLGAFLDPVADKLLMFGGFLSLTVGGFIPWPLAVLVFGRDGLISLGVYLIKRSGTRIVYSPTYLSKLTTLFQIFAVFGGFARTQSIPRFSGEPYDKMWTFVLGITTVLTAVTAVQYTRIGWNLLKKSKSSSATST